jgi:DNA-binding LacI/PurR family transcriptional regulator
MAETSTELLIERLKTGTNRITGVTMSMDLIIRGSTAEPPKQP